MLKIYIAYDDTPYEGCSEPLAAFSTRESADAYVKSLQAEERFSTRYLVQELIVDEKT